MSKKQYCGLISNQLIKTKATLELISPTNLKPFAVTSSMDASHVKEAFSAAKIAFNTFQHSSVASRIELLEKWIVVLLSMKKEFVSTMVTEIAKGEKDATGEFDRTIEFIKLTIAEFKSMHPVSWNTDVHEKNPKSVITKRFPVGVVVAISPFNYPLNLAFSKISPAIIMGNVVIFKPASIGSAIGGLIAESYKKLNTFPGVFNVIIGKGSMIGDSLVEDESIRLINFTGSTNIGQRIASKAKMSALILELGGKDPALVLTNDNLKANVANIIKGAFSYSGQRCTAIKRVLVLDKFYKEFTKELKSQLTGIKVEDPIKSPLIVPLVDVATANYCSELIADAKASKAEMIIEGSIKANRVNPTVIGLVTEKMRIAWEEPFGPVLPIMKVKSIEEAITIANKSEYGLQASIYTNDINQAMSIAHKLECGSVNINSFSQRGPDILSFTGVKHSGLGVQGIKDTLIACSYPRNIVINHK